MAYEFSSVPKVIVGRGESKRVGGIVAGLGRRALVVHNGPAPSFVEGVLVRQKGEPTVADVDGAVEVAKRERCDVVVGVGGGSAIDLGKAVAGLVVNGGNAIDYMEVVGKGRKIEKAGLPFVAVPVTAGTGAEVTKNAVVGLPEKKFKASIRSELLMARVAVVDAELGVGVAREVTAASGMDALCQCIEAYVSKGANAMTDGISLQGVGLARLWLKKAVEDGGNVEAREGMGEAALLSGIALANAGLGAVHGFAAPVGANFPVPHGVVCAALLVGVMRANVEEAKRQGKGEVVGRYQRLGGVEWVEELVGEVGVKKLGAYGMRREDVPGMVDLAKRASSMKYNPVELPEEVLARVLGEAIG